MKDQLSLALERIEQLRQAALQSQKKSLLFIEIFPTQTSEKIRSHKNRETHFNILGFCEVSELSSFSKVLEAADGKVDYIVLDMDQKLSGLENLYPLAREKVSKSALHLYSDHTSWGDALLSLVLQTTPPHLAKNVLLVGNGNLTYKLALNLVEKSYSVTILGHVDDSSQKIVDALNLMKHPFEKSSIRLCSRLSKSETFDIIIGTEVMKEIVSVDILDHARPKAILLDGGIGSLSAETISTAKSKGHPVLRLDNRAAISATVQTILETEDLVKNRMGRETIAGVPVVAAGVMGNNGDIILDSISNPSVIIGVADGAGRVKSELKDSKEIERISCIQSLITPRC